KDSRDREPGQTDPSGSKSTHKDTAEIGVPTLSGSHLQCGKPGVKESIGPWEEPRLFPSPKQREKLPLQFSPPSRVPKNQRGPQRPPCKPQQWKQIRPPLPPKGPLSLRPLPPFSRPSSSVELISPLEKLPPSQALPQTPPRPPLHAPQQTPPHAPLQMSPEIPSQASPQPRQRFLDKTGLTRLEYPRTSLPRAPHLIEARISRCVFPQPSPFQRQLPNELRFPRQVLRQKTMPHVQPRPVSSKEANFPPRVSPQQSVPHLKPDTLPPPSQIPQRLLFETQRLVRPSLPPWSSPEFHLPRQEATSPVSPPPPPPPPSVDPQHTQEPRFQRFFRILLGRVRQEVELSRKAAWNRRQLQYSVKPETHRLNRAPTWQVRRWL
ncbi:hypothetical protein BIW11_05088, partial [Tropilaelaps mercedesae]